MSGGAAAETTPSATVLGGPGPVPGSQDHLAEIFFRRHRRQIFLDGQRWHMRVKADGDRPSAIRAVGDQAILSAIRMQARSAAQQLPEVLRLRFCSAAHAAGALTFARADPRFQATTVEVEQILMQRARRVTLLSPDQRRFEEHFHPVPAAIQRRADAEARQLSDQELT